MATTTNYSWTTPDDTALVKDGAAAIRTLGSSVDTTVKNLNPETTLGDIAYRSSTANVKTRLALGTAGQVLTVNSGATAPEWATVSAGGMTSIASGSLSGSSVVLGSIPTTYNQLFLELKDHYPAANGYGVDVIITGVTSNYKGIYIYNQSSSGVGVTTTTTFSREAAYALNNADNNNYMGLWLINYASSVRKIANVFGSFYTNGAVNYITNSTVYHDTTAAITSLTIGLEGGTATTFAGGTYTLWGIK